MKNEQKGFTLIELLVAIGVIAVLAGIVIVALNPARQFAQARNTKRTSNVTAILNAVTANLAENQGTFTCSAGAVPTTTATIANAGGYDIYDCIVPTYIPSLPFDPSIGSFVSSSTYNTEYTIIADVNGRITIGAPNAELGASISATR